MKLHALRSAGRACSETHPLGRTITNETLDKIRVTEGILVGDRDEGLPVVDKERKDPDVAKNGQNEGE